MTRLHTYIPRSLIYAGSTLNVVVVSQFHDNMLRNPLHCPHMDDRLHSISKVSSMNELIRKQKTGRADCEEQLYRKLE